MLVRSIFYKNLFGVGISHLGEVAKHKLLQQNRLKGYEILIIIYNKIAIYY